MVDAKDSLGLDSLQNILNKLYNSEDHYDLEIVCEGNAFKCHSFLLWTRSKYFAVAFKGGFKESVTQRIEFPEENANLILKMVAFSYYENYIDGSFGGKSKRPEHQFRSILHTNAEMYILGEKYDLPALKKLALVKFDNAEKEMVSKAKRDHVLSLIPLVYTGTLDTDRGLRDRMVQYVTANAKELAKDSKIKSLITENPDFVLEVIGNTVPPKAPTPYTRACRRCKATDKWKTDHVICSCGWREKC